MKMKPTGTQTGFSHGTPGREYRLDANGMIDVPEDAVEIALSHGFRSAEPDAAASVERRLPRRPKN
jgi:hypothetical protein